MQRLHGYEGFRVLVANKVVGLHCSPTTLEVLHGGKVDVEIRHHSSFEIQGRACKSTVRVVGTGMVTHKGGCHCGAVRFEFEAGAKLIAWDCNCAFGSSDTGLEHTVSCIG